MVDSGYPKVRKIDIVGREGVFLLDFWVQRCAMVMYLGSKFGINHLSTR